MSWQESNELLNNLLAPQPSGHTKVYVEWGSGGSTELVAYLALSGHADLRAYSIESSLTWMGAMRKRSDLIAAAERAGKLRFIHGDIGPTQHLGYPAHGWNASDTRATRRYVGLGQIGEPFFDLVLDDGRFRVACALEALSWLRRGSGIVLLHDFAVRTRGASATRVSQYTEGLITPEFYSVVRKNETLGVLMVGREARNEAAVAEAMERALRLPQ